MPVHTPFPKNRNLPRPNSAAAKRDSSLHVLRDPLETSPFAKDGPAIAKPRALAAANPNGISMKPAQLPPNATMMGMAAPTIFEPRKDTPNGTMLGHSAFAQAVEQEVDKIRFAEGTKPQRMTARSASQGVADPVAAAKPSSQVASPPSVEVKLDQPAVQPADKPTQGQWQSFEQIGLSAPKPITQKAQKLVVSGYRLLGFGILTLIVFVLVGYIATTIFYFVNTTWVAPVAVSPTDEKVMQLQAELANQQNKRDQLADQLAQAERAIETEANFQLEYAKAIRHDLEGRTVALQGVQRLAGQARAARVEITRTNQDYARQADAQMKAEYDAGLIDRQKKLAGNYQLAQIKTSTLSLAEREQDFQQKAADLATETKSLDAILNDKKASALSYDVLKIKRDYDQSKLALANDMQIRQSLKQGVERQDALIDTLKKSSYLRALSDKVTIAFVPYGNLDNAKKGTDLYACKVAMVFCRKVGAVVDILPGEVQFKHPRRDKLVRGRMIELKLDSDELAAAEDDILFAGSKPFWF
jgi:hypothetical protein